MLFFRRWQWGTSGCRSWERKAESENCSKLVSNAKDRDVRSPCVPSNPVGTHQTSRKLQQTEMSIQGRRLSRGEDCFQGSRPSDRFLCRKRQVSQKTDKTFDDKLKATMKSGGRFSLATLFLIQWDPDIAENCRKGNLVMSHGYHFSRHEKPFFRLRYSK